jgi:hypothetical protein
VNEIRISPAMQTTLLLAVIAAIAAAVAAQLPELRRYMKMEKM